LRRGPVQSRAMSAQRDRELEAVGIRDKAARDQQLHQEAAAMAFQNGRNPADVIYRLAQARGYAAPQPVAAAREPSPPTRELISSSRVSRRERAPRSIPSRAEDLLRLSDREFGRVINTPAGRALLGA
jgi:hypothetical protein